MTRSTARNDVKILQRLLSSNFGEGSKSLIDTVRRRSDYIEIQQQRQKRETEMIKQTRKRMMKINASN